MACMDVQDIIFDPDVSLHLKTTLLELCHEHRISGFTQVLTPSASNNDVNGSQHSGESFIDFTYRDVDMDDVESASTLGYYEYFSNYGVGYTGHYYNGDGRHFDAVVIDPPAYAASHSV